MSQGALAAARAPEAAWMRMERAIASGLLQGDLEQGDGGVEEWRDGGGRSHKEGRSCSQAGGWD